MSLFTAFQKGEQVDNPAAVKKSQLAVNIVGLLLLLVDFLKPRYPALAVITPEVANEVVIAVLGVYNVVATLVSSRKIGIGGQY